MEAGHECETILPSRRFFISALLGTAAAVIIKPASANVDLAVKFLESSEGAGAFGFDSEWKIVIPKRKADGKIEWVRFPERIRK